MLKEMDFLLSVLASSNSPLSTKQIMTLLDLSGYEKYKNMKHKKQHIRCLLIRAYTSGYADRTKCKVGRCRYTYKISDKGLEQITDDSNSLTLIKAVLGLAS